MAMVNTTIMAMEIKKKLNNNINQLIDIHSHIIHEVDDGSSNIQDSVSMIQEEMNNGVKTIICTPHYRTKMFEETNEVIEQRFHELEEEVKKQHLDVQLYLGREIYIRSMSGSIDRMLERIESNMVRGMNNTPYYLLEFSYTNEIEISEIVYTMNNKGLKPIIAHVERYSYVDSIEKLSEIKSAGALIQVNASAIVGKDGLKIKSKVWKYLKSGLVDIVSSDIHSNRVNYMKKAYEMISKKISNKLADELFINNPSKILD